MYKCFYWQRSMGGERGKPGPIDYETGLGYALGGGRLLICLREELKQRLISQLHTYYK